MLETTLVIIVVVGVAFLVYITKACFMSKCRKVKLGCIEIERDTSGEQSARNLHFEVPKI